MPDEIKYPKHMTATDEAMYRLKVTAVEAMKLYETIPWWNIKERFIGIGTLSTLKMVMEMLHQLHHKYDNQDGRLN